MKHQILSWGKNKKVSFNMSSAEFAHGTVNAKYRYYPKISTTGCSSFDKLVMCLKSAG